MAPRPRPGVRVATAEGGKGPRRQPLPCSDVGSDGFVPEILRERPGPCTPASRGSLRAVGVARCERPGRAAVPMTVLLAARCSQPRSVRSVWREPHLWGRSSRCCRRVHGAQRPPESIGRPTGAGIGPVRPGTHRAGAGPVVDDLGGRSTRGRPASLPGRVWPWRPVVVGRRWCGAVGRVRRRVFGSWWSCVWGPVGPPLRRRLAGPGPSGPVWPWSPGWTRPPVPGRPCWHWGLGLPPPFSWPSSLSP